MEIDDDRDNDRDNGEIDDDRDDDRDNDGKERVIWETDWDTRSCEFTSADWIT